VPAAAAATTDSGIHQLPLNPAVDGCLKASACCWAMLLATILPDDGLIRAWMLRSAAGVLMGGAADSLLLVVLMGACGCISHVFRSSAEKARKGAYVG
jgi:hypothetical protein